MKRELIDVVLENCSIPADVRKEILSKLFGAEEIQTRRNEAKSRLDKALEAYKDARAAYEQDMRKIQDACPHLVLHFSSDPSGNGDSSMICQICGREN